MYTKINDYIPKLQELFPDISESDIKRSIIYGWRMFYYYNLCGCDTIATNDKCWFYCGNLYYDSLLHFEYYKRKLCYKIRLLFRRNRTQWDGYYYTYVDTPKRKNSTYNITNRFIFKLLDEAKVYYSSKRHFVKFKIPIDLGYKRYRKKMKIQKANIIYTREKPATFKDILVSQNDYQFV